MNTALIPERQRLCDGCGNLMGDDDLGGVARGVNNTEVWFHNASECIIKAADMTASYQAHEMRLMGRDLNNGKTTYRKGLSEYKTSDAGEGGYEY